ncbi:MAG: DUF3857 and transglutaminase domain-containing protein [Bacteroidota bacterium]
MRLIFNTLLLLIVTKLSIAQANVEIGPPSKWINEIDPPNESDVSKYDVKSGSYFKLIDYQVDIDDAEFYSHYVYNVLTSGGISNVSQLQISYDSSYQEVIFHRYRVHRKGQILDRTSEIAFEYIKNEQQLQSNIYMGQVTALSVLPDIRRDDWVEVSYTIRGSNPVFEDNRYYLIPIEDINPIDQISIRIRYDKKDTINYTLSSKEITTLKEEIDNKQILSVNLKNLEAVKIEETTPPWIIPFRYLEISNTESWNEVNKWALDLFKSKEDNQITEVFDEIFYPDFDKEDKINAIIDFVQDEIRYMGIETGIGSIVPFSPNQVINQRFGDCKDKSLLMCSMMNKIGIEAYPALVNNSLLGHYSKRLKSGYLFNHVIVRFTYEGKHYWVDPTFSYQGGDYSQLKTFDYEKALVVKEGTTGLSQMELSDTISQTKLLENFDLTSYNVPGKLDIQTSMKGSKADETRAILEYYSLKELADYYKSYYNRIYPTLIEEARLKVKDDVENNILETIERYQIPQAWKDDQEGFTGKWVFNYQPVSLYSYLFNLSCEKKRFPVYYHYPAKFYQETFIEFPQGIKVDSDEKSYDNNAFSFKKTIRSVTPNKVQLTYSYVSKTKEISPKDFSDVCLQIDEITESLPMVFYFSKITNLENLPIEYIKIKLKDIALTETNAFFRIDSVACIKFEPNEIIGFNISNNDKISAYILENGIEEDFENYLNRYQTKSETATPLVLTINNLQITQKTKQNKYLAILEYDYSVTFKKNNTIYGFRWKDSIENEGTDKIILHENNIRQSLSEFIEKLHPEKFIKVNK